MMASSLPQSHTFPNFHLLSLSPRFSSASVIESGALHSSTKLTLLPEHLVFLSDASQVIRQASQESARSFCLLASSLQKLRSCTSRFLVTLDIGSEYSQLELISPLPCSELANKDWHLSEIRENLVPPSLPSTSFAKVNL